MTSHTLVLARIPDGLMGLEGLKVFVPIYFGLLASLLLAWLHCASFLLRNRAPRTRLSAVSAAWLILGSLVSLWLVFGPGSSGSAPKTSEILVSLIAIGLTLWVAFVPLRRSSAPS